MRSVDCWVTLKSLLQSVKVGRLLISSDSAVGVGVKVDEVPEVGAGVT